MHKIHHTEGFIISGIDTKEADRFLTIFTKDFGLIRASAGGVRKLSSKLRYVLHELSHANIDLVEGRDVWRITSASKGSVFDGLSEQPALVPVFGRIFSLVVRLCRGEEGNASLYDALLSGFRFIIEHGTSDRKDHEVFEMLIVLKMLSHLGYDSGTHAHLSSIPFSEASLAACRAERDAILSDINRTLKETHL